MNDDLIAEASAIGATSQALLNRVAPLASAGDRTLNPRRWILRPDPGAALFACHDDALRWFDANVHTVQGCVYIAHSTANHVQAWQLCESLWSWLTLRRDLGVWEGTHRLGLASAEALGDLSAEAQMLSKLGACRLWRQHPTEAAHLLRRAKELWEAVEHPLGIASNLESLGTTMLKAGRPSDALAFFQDAQVRFAAMGRQRGVMIMERHLGEAHRDRGDLAAAQACLDRALAWFELDGDVYMRVRTLHQMAALHVKEGRSQEAVARAREALALAEVIGADREVTDLSRLISTSNGGVG